MKLEVYAGISLESKQVEIQPRPQSRNTILGQPQGDCGEQMLANDVDAWESPAQPHLENAFDHEMTANQVPSALMHSSDLQPARISLGAATASVSSDAIYTVSFQPITALFGRARYQALILVGGAICFHSAASRYQDDQGHASLLHLIDVVGVGLLGLGWWSCILVARCGRCAMAVKIMGLSWAQFGLSIVIHVILALNSGAPWSAGSALASAVFSYMLLVDQRRWISGLLLGGSWELATNVFLEAAR